MPTTLIPKRGDIFETPHGKIRFEGIQEGFETIPDSQMYTFMDGIAKGSSFNSKSHSAMDLAESEKRMLKLYEKHAEVRNEI